MAITAIVGRPGHGKSYSACEIAIIPALQEGRALYTNIPLHDDAIARDYPGARVHYVTLDQTTMQSPDFWQFEPGALVILDELWRVWPSGLKASHIPVFQLAFIKEHRHRTDENGRWQDIVIVTQNLSDIAAAIREMVETTVMCQQLQDVGATGWFIRSYYTGAVKGCDNGPASMLVNNERIKYRPEVFQYYVSNTQGVNTAVGPQGAKVVQQNLWTSWKFRAFVVALVVILITLVGSVWKTKKGLDKATEQAKPVLPAPVAAPAPPPPPAPVAPPPVVAPPVAVQPVPSERWRLAGVVRSPGGAVAMLTDGSRTRRIDYREHCRDGAETQCTIGGELVASWTGPAERAGQGVILPLQTTK